MKKNLLAAIVAVTAACLGGAAPAAAAPWRWAFTLDGQAVGAPMRNVTGVYVDGQAGRYYVVDAGDNRILSFDREGKFLSLFAAAGGLHRPVAAAKDGQRRLWILERGRNSLTRVDFAQKKLIPHEIRDRGREVVPDGLQWAEGRFYVLDRASGRVLALDGKLAVAARFAGPRPFRAFRVRGDALYALDLPGREVRVFGLDGRLRRTIALEGGVRRPAGLEVGPSGFLFVLDRHRHDVAVFDTRGRLKYRFLGEGQARGRLYYPAALVFDPWGRLCVADEGNGRVQVFMR
ncbi:hypothetical protein G3N55_01470 [Dissulfurirhabdus thermomarina]|uniref:6-bladed beta-propeller n=1 Tax=Dissulfurirhabdus thermomarina TaxID=1765737 RepID=A0A6N9TN79_DISTH|nr:hypothetical protein [Dissulfurirhabdus thermomarina]NDY41523.1 hypothetical protein [Dissulfurirhabdus thermomarina]NMX22958.1 hypothetical protein [Dissulfurirhabdus thermomarina]